MEQETIKRDLLSDAVIKAIQKQIIDGKLQPGDQLPSEKEMCKLFSVGRSTLREAIKALTVMNLLDKGKRGTFVSKSFAPLSETGTCFNMMLQQVDYRDLLEARKVLEVTIAGMSAERATAEDIKLLESIIERLDLNIKQNNYKGYIEEDLNFHHAIAASTQNKYLLNQIVTIRESLIELYENLLSSSVIPHCQNHHNLILKAIRDGDRVAAEKLMTTHLEDVEDALNEEMKRCMEGQKTEV